MILLTFKTQILDNVYAPFKVLLLNRGKLACLQHLR